MPRIALIVLTTTVLASTSLHAEEPAKADSAPAQFPKPPETAKLSAKDLEHIEALIKQLSSDSFDEREKADATLRALGKAVAEPLTATLKQGLEPEARKRVEQIVAEVQVEIWEGYYCYSNAAFDKAVEASAPRVRFTMKVKRDARGNFEASAEEQGQVIGKSTMKGQVDPANGRLTFEKTSTSNSEQWNYEGQWNAKTQRIEGGYMHGKVPQEGGFVLYPRKLTEAETKKYDQDPREIPYDQLDAIEKD